MKAIHLRLKIRPLNDDGYHDGHAANQECTPPTSYRSRARVPARNDRCHDILLDMGSPATNMTHAKTCKEVERLNALVSATQAAIDVTVQI